MPTKKKYNTYSDNHIQIFIDTFTRLVDMFGMSDFGIKFLVVSTTKYAARIEYNVSNRCVIVNINRNMLTKASEEACNKHMRAIAAHEFAHLLTADLYQGAISKDYTSEDISRSSEIVSRRFEYAIDKILPEGN